MEQLKARLKKQGGFTLIEMLIVVAIIAILIAIAIPMVNRALESAREATDEANMRAAVGIAMADYMMGDEDNTAAGGTFAAGDGVLTSDVSTEQIAWYVISPTSGSKNGYLTKTAPTKDKGYGKGTTLGADTVEHTNQYVKITVAKDSGEVTGEWADPS